MSDSNFDRQTRQIPTSKPPIKPYQQRGLKTNDDFAEFTSQLQKALLWECERKKKMSNAGNESPLCRRQRTLSNQSAAVTGDAHKQSIITPPGQGILKRETHDKVAQ